MSMLDGLFQGSLKTLGVAAATAMATGVATAGYLELPSDFRINGDGVAQPILGEDPGRAKWREVIASLGGLGATFVIPIAYYTRPAADPPIYDTGPDRELERLVAEVDGQLREAEVRHARWDRDAEWYRRQAAMAETARMDRQAWEERAYGYAPEPPPEPVRRYSSVRYYPVESVYEESPRYVEVRYRAPMYERAPPAEYEEPVPPPPPVPYGW